MTVSFPFLETLKGNNYFSVELSSPLLQIPVEIRHSQLSLELRQICFRINLEHPISN